MANNEEMTMDRYERVTYRPAGATRSTTKLLRNPTETTFADTPALTGIEVDRTGDEVAPHGTDERRHIIDLAAITRRTPMVMNLHYGELEPAPAE